MSSFHLAGKPIAGRREVQAVIFLPSFFIPDFADISNIAAKSRILEIIFKLKI
jgi:hypothetical protein